MNSKERVFAAVEGLETDRRPFTVMLSLYGARLTECPLSLYYTDPVAYVRGQSAAREIFQPDILFSPFILPAIGEAFGSKVKMFENSAPNLKKPAIKSADEIPQLEIPDIDSHPRLVYIRESLRQISAAHGNDTAIAGILLNPVDLPIMIMGMDAWLEAVLFNPDGVKRMLDITIPFFIKFANALLSDGAQVLVIPSAFLNPSVVTREIAEKFTLPVLKTAFSDVNGPMILHHVGSPFLSFLELFTGLPNIAGFAIDFLDSPHKAREKVGDTSVLLSGPDGPNMWKMKSEEIEAQCTDILENRRDDPHFILITSRADLDFRTPPENIHAVRKAIENFSSGNVHADKQS